MTDPMADSEVTKRAVTVYGASSEEIDPRYKEAAYELGRRIAEAGCSLVCGGGKAGLMKAAIDGAVDAGGDAIGVLPHFMVENAWQYERLTRMIDTPDMHSRKQTMAELSCAAMAGPGGDHHMAPAQPLPRPSGDSQHLRILRPTAPIARTGRGAGLHAC